MIGVARANAFEVALRALGDDEVRPTFADDAREGLAQLESRFHLAVRPAQERQVGDPHRQGRRRLFRFANVRALLPGVRRIISPGVTRGDEAVRDVDAVTG